ncbi:MAG: O-antigen ligase family protein [Pseudomonadota bacterium]
MTPARVTGPWAFFSWPLKFLVFAAWILYLLFFSLNLASGEWVMVAAMAGLVGAIALVMFDLRFLAVLWFAGSPTIFVFANNVLDALPFATVERAIFFGLAIIVLISFALRKREGLERDGVEKAILTFLGITLVSMLFNMGIRPDVLIKQDIAFYLQGYFLPMLSYWLMRRLDWTEEWVVRYLWFMVAGSVILAAQGVSQVYFGMGFFMPTWIEVINQGRATGSFSNATEYGIACLIPMLYGLLLQARSNDKARWLFLLLLVGAAALGLILCKTRAPWLAAVISCGIIFYYDRRQRPLIAVAISLGITALLIILPFVIDSDLFQRRILDLDPIYARVAQFASGVKMLIDNPILGIGFGKASFETDKGAYLTTIFGISYQEGASTGPPHNEWLGMLTLTGIFGFICFVAIHVLAWRKLSEIRRNPDLPPFQRLMSVYVLCIFVSQIVISFFVDLGYLIYSTSATYGAIGIVASRWRTEPKKPPVKIGPPTPKPKLSETPA